MFPISLSLDFPDTIDSSHLSIQINLAKLRPSLDHIDILLARHVMIVGAEIKHFDLLKKFWAKKKKGTVHLVGIERNQGIVLGNHIFEPRFDVTEGKKP